MTTGNKKRKSEADKTPIKQSAGELSARLGQTIYADSLQLFEEALVSAFDKNRDYYLHSLLSQMRSIPAASAATTPQHGHESGWVEIDSLSKLRSIVGGRFQNIKSKWTNAGFPLKEHRGDKMPTYQLDQAGWIDLTNWIIGQGYEARLPNGGANFLFEIRGTGQATRG